MNPADALARELNALVEAIGGLDRLAAEATSPTIRSRAAKLRDDLTRRTIEMSRWLRGQVEEASTNLIHKSIADRAAGAGRMRRKSR